MVSGEKAMLKASKSTGTCTWCQDSTGKGGEIFQQNTLKKRMKNAASLCIKNRFSSVVFNSIIQHLTALKSLRNLLTVQNMNEIDDPLAYPPLPGKNRNSDVA